jgi:hypothetical protein
VSSNIIKTSMSSDKGKARAQDDEAASQTRPEEPQDPSIASRVAASARGLTRSAFASPNGNELSQSAAAALANSGKGQAPSTGGSAAWAENSRASQQPTPQTSSSNAFRPSQNEEHIRQSENEFSSFLDGIDSFTPSENLEANPSEALNGGFGEAWTRSQVPLSVTPSMPAEYRTVAEQEQQDGKDVLAILSSSEDMDAPFEAPPEDNENYDWGLTQEQISELRAMTKDFLPPPEPHKAASPSNALNLVPHVEDADFINVHSQAAVDAWRDQWEGVLTRYADEVWGGLLPLVKEARKEVEGMQSGEEQTVQPKALRRLGAILGHLREY